MRIIVNPDELQQLVQQLRGTSRELRSVGNRISSAIGGLNWEARYKAGIDAQVNQARSQANALANQADALAQYLSDKARAFENADRSGADAVGRFFLQNRQRWSSIPYRLVYPFPSPRIEAQMLSQNIARPSNERIAVPTPTPILRTELGKNISLGSLIEVSGKFLKQVELAAIIALLATTWVDVMGRMHIYGPEWFKMLAGVSKKLTWIKPENFPLHMAKQALKIGRLTLISLIPVWYSAFQEYGGQGNTKLISALIVDTALHLAISKGFMVIGALVGAALLPGPVGIAIGIIAVGGIGGSLAENWLHKSPIRKMLVDGTASVIDTTIQTAVTTANTLQQTAQRITNALNNPINALLGPQADPRLTF